MNVRLNAIAALLVSLGAFPLAAEARRVIPLDGVWEIAEGTMDQTPKAFDHRVPVPGLADMAEPAFAEVGQKSARRQAFWYRRTFKVEGPVPAVATLRIAKAGYGTRVILNGKPLGDHPPSFTSGYFDARAALRGGGEANELLVRVGAWRDAVPESIPAGFDFEKSRYIPGIFDAVELILSGTPHIVRVQTVPDIAAKTVRVQALIRNAGEPVEARVHGEVRAAKGGEKAGAGESAPVQLGRDDEKTVDFKIPIPDCHLWSPEEPFLYELEASTGADSLQARFGIREFRIDPATSHAVLNGKPCFLRGSNVCIYRFFEDPQRGDKPWREEWVRRLHEQFKAMHWNSLRYCIGFPPEMWYRIADEEGILIQDEFPIWHGGQWPAALKADELVKEYTEWMQERWNHPCVVIWDAQNESVTTETGKAIGAVRSLDLSNRPWDNGWSKPEGPLDIYESHPYLFGNPNFKIANLARGPKSPGGNPVGASGKNPIIINEYDWLWLNRDGTPTTLSREAYKAHVGADATPAQRRYFYARTMAALTEYWRSLHVCAGVMEFCGLGYSRPGGQTCDHFTDIEKLTFDPDFQKYVGDAFAPIGVMLDEWAEELPGGAAHEFHVVVTNDRDRPLTGVARLQISLVLDQPTITRNPVTASLEISLDGKALSAKAQPFEVESLGQKRLAFTVDIPPETGKYLAIGEIVLSNRWSVSSLRDFEVITPEERARRNGIALGKPVKASSSVTMAGATTPEAAVDGRTDTRWSSEFSDPQWLAVNLGKVETIDHVELLWEAAYAKAFSVETSVDGQTWKEVYKTDRGDGRPSVIRFPPTEARWVRFTGTQRGTQFGYSLWEFRVFRAK